MRSPDSLPETEARLTEGERREILGELSHYPNRKAASIDALKIVQRRLGWVPDATLAEVAALLGMTAEELDSVATFYNLIYRRRVGRHVILLCDSISCWVVGYDAVRQALEATLGIGFGETTPDGRFTLLPICCLGACDKAPVLLIDEDRHELVDAASLTGILQRYE